MEFEMLKSAPTETQTVYTLWDALTAAVLTFYHGDAVCSWGDTWCPVSDLAVWMATLPAAQCAARRYVARRGDITERTTGRVVSGLVSVVAVPADVRVRKDGMARVRTSQMVPQFTVQSISFLRTDAGYDRMVRVRPVSLGEDGLEFEDIRAGATS